jgi:SAM-dependent methyltransferase
MHPDALYRRHVSTPTPSAGEASPGSFRSYASASKGVRGLLREARGLYALHMRSAEERVALVLSRVRTMESVLRERYGLELQGKEVLDIGIGQQLVQLSYFASRNDATGIDLDVVASGFAPAAYFRMLRVNGLRRTVKTLGRKALLVDVRYARVLRKELGAQRGRLRVLRMDVNDMSFPDASFDFAYCSSVLHHLPDPGKALDEIARVIRPGGVAAAGLQLYTSETGSLDPRLSGPDRTTVPAWAHLRPAHRHLVSGNAHVNGLRLLAWRELFADRWPGCSVAVGQPHRARLEPVAIALQADGELTQFSVSELVSHDLWVDWQKPVLP